MPSRERVEKMNLKGKAALVTGGSRGIGRAVSIRLAGEGAFVFVNYSRSEEAARETLRRIGEVGGKERSSASTWRTPRRQRRQSPA